ncbi:MAG: hypothetical protein KDD82_01660 [Planctomycetes bacterium]|nr:hypothetical protein [Planctomycetota bacterium]
MAELDEETLSQITAHVLESIWAHLEEQGLEGFPARVVAEARDSQHLTGERIEALEAKLAGLDGGSSGAGGDLEQRLSALEKRVAALGEGPAGLGAKVDELIEEKLEDLDLEALRDRVLRSVRSRLGDDAGGSGSPDLGQLKQELKQELSEELGAVGATAATVSEGASPNREELIKLLDLEKIARRLEHMAIHPVLKAIDQRMKSANLDEVAEEAAEKAISKRFSSDLLEQASGQGAVAEDLDGKLKQLEERLLERIEEQSALGGSAGGMLQDEEGEPIRLTEDRHFLALAREVKTLRDSLNLVEMFNSREFKEIFDRRINQVISYLRNDAIPSAVKKALQQA